MHQPIMEGPAAAAIIRGLGIQWPIFGLTGCVFETDVKVFLEAGANKVFTKPLHVVDFKSAMADIQRFPSRWEHSMGTFNGQVVCDAK